MKKAGILFLFLILCFSIAGIGGYVTSNSVTTWYVTLKKPEWNPPSWLFGPVWTVLYIFIALSGWLIWMERDKSAKAVLVVYFIQLVFNGLWTPIFFGLHNPLLAFIEICFLWLSIGIFIYLSWNVSLIASLLFIPYFCWVTFAAILNFTIWSLNRL
jgi:translocator protein